jgi:hypothetical protein
MSLIGGEGCNNNNAREKYIIEPTKIGKYCEKRSFNLEYITPDGKYVLLQKTPTELTKPWTTVLCKSTKRIKKIYQVESFNGQSISPVPLTVFNQIAWTFVHRNRLTWMTCDTKTEKLKQVVTDTTFFGPNFITQDFVLGFDVTKSEDGPYLRYLSKNSNKKIAVDFKKPNSEHSFLELSDKRDSLKCLYVAKNWLLFDMKAQNFLDIDTRQDNDGICTMSHDKKSCVVSSGLKHSLSLVTYAPKLSIQKLKGKFGQACFSNDDTCIYCLDMKNSLIKEYSVLNQSFETIMEFDAKNYPNYRLFPMQEGGFLMYWPNLNYVHIKPK